jgi:hypothetical protein
MDIRQLDKLWELSMNGYITPTEVESILHGNQSLKEATIESIFTREENMVIKLRRHPSFRETDSPEDNPICKMLERHLYIQSFIVNLLD